MHALFLIPVCCAVPLHRSAGFVLTPVFQCLCVRLFRPSARDQVCNNFALKSIRGFFHDAMSGWVEGSVLLENQQLENVGLCRWTQYVNVLSDETRCDPGSIIGMAAFLGFQACGATPWELPYASSVLFHHVTAIGRGMSVPRDPGDSHRYRSVNHDLGTWGGDSAGRRTRNSSPPPQYRPSRIPSPLPPLGGLRPTVRGWGGQTGGGATQTHRTREPHQEGQGRAQQTRRRGTARQERQPEQREQGTRLERMGERAHGRQRQ